MTKPYTKTSSAEELADLMDKQLKQEQDIVQFAAIKNGIEKLNKAAGILEHLQQHRASEAITVILEKLAGVK